MMRNNNIFVLILFLKQVGLTQNGVTSALAKTSCIAPENAYCEVN